MLLVLALVALGVLVGLTAALGLIVASALSRLTVHEADDNRHA